MIKALFTIGLITVLFACGSSGPSENAAGVSAQFHAEAFIKSPATADFGHADVTDKGNGVYHVKNYVDSQNSFGATVRSRYSCTVTYKNGKYKISDFEIK